MDEMNNNPVQNEQPETNARFCPNCGKPQAADALFCGTCGTRLNGNSTPAPAMPAASVKDTKPLKTSDYLLMFLLMCVPIVALIVFLIWAFSSDTNVHRRNFSRGYLLYYLIISAVSLIFGIIIGAFVMSVGVGLVEELMLYSAILPML